jgi:hypothetical protein
MERLVTIVVSDPWEFPDENEGRLAFVADVVGNANGLLLLRLRVPVVYKGRTWLFAIPSPRYVGQHNFEGGQIAANIGFITEDQAASEDFRSTYDSRAKPETPWVIGSVEPGVSDLIPPGCESHTEPSWVPPGQESYTKQQSISFANRNVPSKARRFRGDYALFAACGILIFDAVISIAGYLNACSPFAPSVLSKIVAEFIALALHFPAALVWAVVIVIAGLAGFALNVPRIAIYSLLATSALAGAFFSVSARTAYR